MLERALVADAPLDALGDELLDVLDVALEVAVLEKPRAFIAPSEPMPRYSLKRSPWTRITSPGVSSVPASSEPIMTASAPAAIALAMSPE